MKNRQGQVMLVTVLVLGATLFGAITIGGLVLVYQLRQTSDLEDSTRAVFAADAGIEWGLYQKFQSASSLAMIQNEGYDPGHLVIGDPVQGRVTSETLCFSTTSSDPTSVTDCSNALSIEGFGTSAAAKRAFRQVISVP